MSRGVSTPTQPAIHAFPRRASNSMTTPKISIARPHHRFTFRDASGGPVVITKKAISSITPRITKKEPIGMRRSSICVYQNQRLKRMQAVPTITASRMGRLYQGTFCSTGIFV